MKAPGALWLVTAAAAFGHHSFVAEFDAAKPVHLAGIVSRFEFVNPHAVIYLDVGPDRWWIEAASPQALIRRGISRTTLRPGSQVEIEGYAAKDGSRRAYGREIKLNNGQVFLLNPGS